MEETGKRNTPERVSSPEQLTDYLRVTNPGIWMFLASVVLLLAGLFAWAAIGTLETTMPVKVSVEEQIAFVVSDGTGTLAKGMPLRVSADEFVIEGTAEDEYGRTVGVAIVTLSDGIYDGTVVTERMHPISYLLESR